MAVTSLLEQEINEQPRVVQQLLDTERENAARLAEKLRGQFEYVVIAARGSSDNAARYAQYLFGAHNRLPVALATPSLFTLYHSPPKLDGALIIGISQSGQSPDIVAVIAEGRKQGRPTLAITNDPASPLAAAAEHGLLLHAGPERAVAASKTYTASLCALALLSAALEGAPERLLHLGRLSDLMQATLSGLAPKLARAERYRFMEHCAVIGRGYNYATAFEIALKIKELTRTVAEPYSSADFRHGPIAVIREGFPAMIVAPAGPAMDDMRALAADLKERRAELLIVSDDAALLEQAHLAMPLPGGTPEWLTPPVAALAGQLFALTLARVKGMDPDQPPGLKKVTATL